MKIFIPVSIIALIVFLSFQTTELKAQKPEGTIRYLRTQNWAKMMASVDYISKQQRERSMYMWGTRSEWKTYTHLHLNASESKYENSEEEAEPGSEGWSNRKETFFMKRNFKDNTLYDGVTLLGKTYLIHDTIVPPKWKIMNDMKEVAGHICMNASLNDTLRKQNTIAWFALDMPVSAGPDRFFGLPGVILEVDVNNGALIMTADKIDLAPLTTELDVPAKIKGRKINMTEYIKLIEKQIKERKAAEEPWFWGISY
ncbi:MAG: GLPGLI family protein [Lentimicrobiaceae bacterium]|jgi:GLPGLI family protein